MSYKLRTIPSDHSEMHKSYWLSIPELNSFDYFLLLSFKGPIIYDYCYQHVWATSSALKTVISQTSSTRIAHWINYNFESDGHHYSTNNLYS